MRKIIFITITLLLTVVASAKKDKGPQGPKTQPIFMYGVSTSFNDSIVYITDIQQVDSAYFIRKYILGGYRDYVIQMDGYFTKSTNYRRTNAVFFSKKRQKAEKAFLKMRKRYAKQNIQLTPLAEGDFKFTSVVPDENQIKAMNAKPEKEEKEKKDKKDKKRPEAPDGKRPPMGGGPGGFGGAGGPGGGPR